LRNLTPRVFAVGCAEPRGASVTGFWPIHRADCSIFCAPTSSVLGNFRMGSWSVWKVLRGCRQARCEGSAKHAQPCVSRPPDPENGRRRRCVLLPCNVYRTSIKFMHQASGRLCAGCPRASAACRSTQTTCSGTTTTKKSGASSLSVRSPWRRKAASSLAAAPRGRSSSREDAVSHATGDCVASPGEAFVESLVRNLGAHPEMARGKAKRRRDTRTQRVSHFWRQQQEAARTRRV